MVHIACEMMWLRSLVTELRFSNQSPMLMYHDNQATIYIVNKLTFHKHTKHSQMDCNNVRDVVMNGYISTPFTSSYEQLAHIFTKGLTLSHFEDLCNKLGIYVYMFQLEWEG